MKKLSYQEKLNLIKPYTTLGINSRKYKAKNPNFERSEKWLITRYYNELKSSGFFDVGKRGQLIEKVKYQPKANKKPIKHAPRIKGNFIPSARPGDIIHGSKIIRDNFTKTFIPIDLEDSPMDDGDLYDFVVEKTFSALKPYVKRLLDGAYFTIVLLGGQEVGQRNRKKDKPQHRREGQAFARDLTGDDKIQNIADKIYEILLRARLQYETKNPDIVVGVYLYEFTNQRQPTATEKKLFKKKGRKNGKSEQLHARKIPNNRKGKHKKAKNKK